MANDISKKDYKYIVSGTSAITVVEVTYDNIIYLVDPRLLIKIMPDTGTLYNKEDSQYEIFIKRVASGTPVKNFAKSKYYKMYLERAKVENPEFLFQ